MTTMPWWGALLSAVVGGMIAGIAGIVGQLMTHRYAAERERIALKRQYLLRAMELVVADGRWLDNYRKCMCFEDRDYTEPRPRDELIALIRLFLPQVSLAAREEYLRAHQSVEAEADEIKIARLQLMATGAPLRGPTREQIDAMIVRMKRYFAATRALQDSLYEVASDFERSYPDGADRFRLRQLLSAVESRLNGQFRKRR